MRFSNDSKFLAAQIAKISKHVDGEMTKAKLEETRERLQQMSESWYDRTLVSFRL